MKSFFSTNSFQKKFFLSYLIILLIFLALMFPFVASSVQKIVFDAMNVQADEIISDLNMAQNEEELVQRLKKQRPFIFYRIAILDDAQRTLYDSHIKSLVKPLFFPLRATSHPEVEEALRQGIGYSEGYSHLLERKLIYFAKSFVYNEKTYVVRIAFPHEYIKQLRKNFEFGFVVFSSVVLILFSVMTGFIQHMLTSPIRQIIQAIRPYQQGKEPYIREISVKKGCQDEFSQLANTLNSLSDRIQIQIETLTHERNEKEAILESLAEGVLATTRDMHISYANTMAIDFLGLTKNDIDLPFPQSLHPRLHELLFDCYKNSKLLFDTVEITNGSKKLSLNVICSPREYKRGVILVLQDKSLQSKMLQMRQNFIANASHELKTPITIIKGFAELLKENPDLPTEKILDCLDKIVRNCNRMTKIISNLLTLADIENLPLSRIGPCNIIKLIKDSTNTIQTIYPESNVSFTFNEQERLEIACDADLIEVAVSNLLDNAAKYSKSAPDISICVEKIPSYIKIQVKDRGIGIPQHDLEYIFQRFYTVNKIESKKKGGSGLGLSIVETIMEKHFGKVYAESELGFGSTFTMLIADDIEQRKS